MDRSRLKELAHKYVLGTATPTEEEQLHRWYDEHDLDEEQVVVTSLPETGDSLRARMLARLLDTIEQERTKTSEPTPVVSIKRSRNWYWAAAAVTIGIVAGTIYFTGRPTVTQPEVAVRFKNDLPAGGNKAILQLANGRTIVLDNAANGELAVDGTTSIVKTADGQLAYNTGAANATLVFNTITTPVGGEYQVTLPDGSKVWLNAMSSLRFPTAFSGNERKVELSGEAYFEVAKNAAKPFKVAIGKTGAPNYNEVQVLGTHFNVHAYTDESSIQTTLLEGKVKVTAGQQALTLSPGEMATVSNAGEVKLEKNADTDAIVAWHEGMFKFREVPIEAIMQQAKRWYGIEVVYDGSIKEHFVSAIPRQSSAVAFFTILEKTGRVQFKIDGKTVTVKSVK